MPFTPDTHAAVNTLEEAGMLRKQAEAVVKAIRQVDSHLATKSDIAESRAATTADIAAGAATRVEIAKSQAAIRAAIAQSGAAIRLEIVELRTVIAEMEAESERRVNRILLGQLVVAGLLFAALKLFP